MKHQILNTVRSLALDFIYYNRKEDEDLPLEAIEKAIAAGEITIDEITDAFKVELTEQLTEVKVSTMNESDLIAKQQLEIENLKSISSAREHVLKKIVSCCVCTTGPLNGNVKGYTSVQMADFFTISELAKSAI